MTATVRKTFSGRWYFVSSSDGVSITNWSSKSQAVAAAKVSHVNVIVER